MKVGDYVRTKDGIILKIKDIEDIYTTDNIYIGMAIYDNEGHFVNDVEITKSSPNIIDLIELGDLVRLFMEDDVDREDTNIFEVVAISNDKKTIGVFTGNFEIEFFPIENLRGIVTKEAFESMEYRIINGGTNGE